MAIGKRAGLTLEEMGELRVRDLITYANIFARAEGGPSQKSKRATQDDIDAFYTRSW